MNETQRRIKEYQKALPHMKERVVAVAVLLAISATMVISTSFAWATLSINPEVSGLATTISANGNLEIALSDIDGLEPDATTVNDGVGDITQTNLKWGNLVNLSHESYGLDYLTLRPASLNTEALDISPMIAVNYSEDGRVQGYLKDFAFSNYNSSAKVFDVFETTRYGVRAISSVTYSNAHAESFYNSQLDKITESMENAKQQFAAIYGNTTYMNTVTSLMGIHVSVLMGSDDISCLSYMTNLSKIMVDVEEVADTVGQTLVDIANLYLYDELEEAGQAGSYASLAYELEDLKANNYNNAFVNKYSSKIKGISNYVAMAKRVDNASAGMENARNTADGDVLWNRDLKTVVSYMCDVNKATLKTSDGEYTTSQLAGSKSIAAGILLSSERAVAIIKEGALKDLDQLLGEPVMVVEGVSIPVKLPDDFGYGMSGRTITLTVNVQTAAKAPYDLPNAYGEAYTFAASATVGDRGTPVAADTYAMAIDFWVRTNESNALLMLEGEIKYYEETTPVMGYNADGVQVPVYEYVTTVVENGTEKESIQELYKVVTGEGESQTVTWYNSQTHEVVNVGTAQPTAKVTVEKTPIGYEGVNRVWNELDDPNSEYSQLIQGGTSTTQGSGSCYIFYPESPEDQAQSKELLSAMHIAFIDQNGKLLGYADMNTDSMIEDAGRVIVPLQMRLQKDTIITGQDENGNDITESYYITPLTQNEAMRITAIIYLDGKTLTNSQVLAAGSINGQLNIQFGLNKMENSPLKDGDLMKEYYSVTADLVNKATGVLAKRDDSMEFYDADTCIWDIEIGIEGTDASTVRGQFVSFINASQGTRQQEFTMTYNEEKHKWVATVPFSAPGEFRLRSIEIDGVDILLPTDQVLYVIIPGKSVSSVLCDNWGGDGTNQSVMTADTSYKQDIHLVLNSSEGTISKVQGVFIGDNGQNVTVDFSTDGGVNYNGTATFTSGGTYKMTYVIIDGVYTPLSESLYKTLTLKLNLRTTVILGLPFDEAYDDLVEEMEAALQAAVTSAQKEEITATYEQKLQDHLNLLHYGNGIPGDENETGLGLIRDSNGNLSFVTDASEPLFIDVRCIITDDQGNVLTNLRDVELLYTAGGISNVLDTDALAEDKNAGYYYGRFTLESNGVFSFYNISFKEAGQDRSYTIYKALSAPTVTAIQPAPMEYVNQAAYAPLTYDLGMSASERVLYIKLKNAAAATLDITLTNGNGETAAPLAVTASEADADNVTTFAVQVPHDGYWEITNVLAKNVFYDGTFYSGVDADTWLNLSQLVQDDEIATHFITEAYIRVTGNTPAQSYTGAFMASHEVKDMHVEVLGSQYGVLMPLETVLRNAGIEADVTFALQYALSLDTLDESYNYTVADGGSMPVYTFTSTYNETDNQATIAEMNFRLPGTYYPTWTVAIDAADDAYDYSFSYKIGTQKATEFTYLNTSSIEGIVVVSWTQLPVVTIKSISPSGSHLTAYYNWGWKTETVNSILTDDYNATVYAELELKSGTLGRKYPSMVNYPYVTLQMTNMGSASGATMTFSESSGSTVLLYPGTDRSNRTTDFVWSAGSTTASRYVGSYEWGQLATLTAAGTLTSKQVKLTYGDMTFTFTLANTITIENKTA